MTSTKPPNQPISPHNQLDKFSIFAGAELLEFYLNKLWLTSQTRNRIDNSMRDKKGINEIQQCTLTTLCPNINNVIKSTLFLEYLMQLTFKSIEKEVAHNSYQGFHIYEITCLQENEHIKFKELFHCFSSVISSMCFVQQNSNFLIRTNYGNYWVINKSSTLCQG